MFFYSQAKQSRCYQLKLKKRLTLFLLLLSVSCVNLSYALESESHEVKSTVFSHHSVVDIAKTLSQSPYTEPPQAPKALEKIDYSTYRQINFQQSAAIWGRDRTPFSIQLFAPGFLYKQLVDIDVVESGKSHPIKLSESSFRVPDESIGKILAEVGRYAGFRLHYPINRKDYHDEFLVFQGASYFRGVSKGQRYGLSTRGLAIDVAGPKGEEFPLFKKFWIERPSSRENAIVVHALLDSVSVTGAYRFAVYPGSPTRMKVDVTLFPRADIAHIGLAPITSMFMFGGIDRADIADYRPAVHDSEVLLIENGKNEKLWRPLTNPHSLQASAFLDENPKGFGLIQPHRQFSYYQDLEATYHLRPSVWIKPLGDWGKGHVKLFEIPSNSEANDNIVAYWEPLNGLKKDQPFHYSYQMTWPDSVPKALGKISIDRCAGGMKLNTDKNEVAIDYKNISAGEIKDINVDASISSGVILESRIEANPYINGARVFITFDPEDVDVAELRVQLKKDDKPLGMTWLYRYTSEDWSQ